MAWLRRAAILGCALAVATAALTFGDPSPPEAKANIACDIGVSPAAPITGALGIGDPVGDACNAVTGAALGALPNPLDPIKEAAQSIGSGIFNQITTWASDGAVWLLGEVVELTQKTTSPNLLSKGFLRQYRQMAAIAVVLAALMLIFAALEGLGRGEGSMLVRIFLVNVPVAAIATSAVYVVVQLLVATTDGFSEVIAHSTAADTREFFKSAVQALGEAGATGGAAVGTVASGPGAGTATGAGSGAVEVPLFVGFIAAIVAAFAAFLVWVELLMRDAAIYAVALFMPLAIAASIWPRWMSALRRTGELVIVVVFSKFVIVSIIALAASLLANTGGKVEHVLAAGALLLLACFAPFVLFKLVPFAEGAVSSAYSRQSAGGASVRTVEFASSVQMMRRAALANWAAGNTKGGGSGGGNGGSPGGGSKGRSGGGGGGSSGGGASAGAGETAGASGGAAGVAALPVAAGVGAARESKAAGERLAGTGTGQAGAEAGNHSAGAGSSASGGAEQRPPRPGAADRASGGEQGSSSSPASSTSAEPTEARGGKAPGSEAKPPRPSGASPKGPAK